MLCLLAAAAAMGQQTLSESIEVRVVNVEVVVTDKAGHRVVGLGRDDFELFEDGIPQKITNFYDVRPPLTTTSTQTATDDASQPPIELTRRRFLLFVDSYSVDPRLRRKVLTSMKKFVETELREHDEASLVVWNRKLDIVRPLTSDRKLLLSSIDDLIEHGNPYSTTMETATMKDYCVTQLEAARSSMQSYKTAYTVCRAAVDRHSEEVRLVSQNLLQSMRGVIATLGGIEGRKVMLLAGGQLAERPGLDLLQWAIDLFAPYVISNENVRNLDQNTDQRIDSANAALMTASRSQGRALESVIRDANAAGVTMYVINAQGAHESMSASAIVAPNESSNYTAEQNTTGSYETLAHGTGGVAVAHPDFDVAFRTVAEDLSSYYSLGYRPGGETNGQRRIVVRMKNPAYTARARENYTTKSNEQEIADRVVANLYHSGVSSDWPINVRIGNRVKEGRNFRVPVEITIPNRLLLLPADNAQLAGGVTMYIATGDEHGDYSGVVRRAQPIRLAADREHGFRDKPIVIATSVLMKRDANRISVGVIDTVSRESGYAQVQLAAK
ncbi:MAG TPA: VWA domain-containing protein [Thermoanaerobaculia bacterium]|nr:VWA domain-containing protein [Thermoanaerobaculia bacterium]